MAKRLGTKKKKVLVDALIERDGTLCTWCCREMIRMPIMPFEDCSAYMTLEHIVPMKHGGTHDLFNLALACFECNNDRGDCLDWELNDDDLG